LVKTFLKFLWNEFEIFHLLVFKIKRESQENLGLSIKQNLYGLFTHRWHTGNGFKICLRVRQRLFDDKHQMLNIWETWVIEYWILNDLFKVFSDTFTIFSFWIIFKLKVACFCQNRPTQRVTRIYYNKCHEIVWRRCLYTPKCPHVLNNIGAEFSQPKKGSFYFLLWKESV